jgi:serine/threonine protein kinase
MALVPWQTRIGNYLLLKQIGKGSFASVWAARHEVLFTAVAVKVISKGPISSPEKRTCLVRELSLQKQMHHPCVAEFFEALEDADNIYFVMEYVGKGDMRGFIGSRTRLAEAQARHYFSQLLIVLEYLHAELHICHRDLKADNIMLDHFDSIRLIDFGLSKQFSVASPDLTTRCGSPAYAAPEMISGHSYTTSANMWSAGVVLFFMVAGVLPWQGSDVRKLLADIVNTDPVYPDFMSPPLVDLLKKLLVKNPAKRITIPRIKEHPGSPEWPAQSSRSTSQDSALTWQPSIAKSSTSSPPSA